MTVACFDSSAFVKLLVDKDGSDVAVRMWDEMPVVAASRLAYPEVRAALAAARRAARLTRQAERRASDEWDMYWADTEVIELTPAIAGEAAFLAAEHALSGADAVHLAGAVALADADPVLIAWDARLRTAALTRGLVVAPARV